MAGYIVMATDGTLTEHAEVPTSELVSKHVGPEGWARVRFHERGHFGFGNLSGWVNDIGLLAPETYARNPVGACVMACFGANQQPYAGPVVITGWDPDPYSDGSEIRPMPDHLVTIAKSLHSKVWAALDGGSGVSPEWDADVRRYADHVRGGATPAITVHEVQSPEELRRLLAGGR